MIASEMVMRRCNYFLCYRIVGDKLLSYELNSFLLYLLHHTFAKNAPTSVMPSGHPPPLICTPSLRDKIPSQHPVQVSYMDMTQMKWIAAGAVRTPASTLVVKARDRGIVLFLYMHSTFVLHCAYKGNCREGSGETPQ
jgi:hypothetical protein